MSITNFLDVCKSHIRMNSLQETILLAILVLLVTESIYISRLIDNYYNNSHEIVIENDWLKAANINENESQIDKKIVASKNGKRYYFLHCSGVKRIKEANKIYFISESEAKKRGLTLASNCS